MDIGLPEENSPAVNRLSRKEKRQKSEAFKSFLKKNENQELTVIPQNNLSDQQVLEIEERKSCIVCNVEILQKKRYCGFCRELSCNDHLRKKRKQPKTNKFVRICDSCEDKHLYDKYMKLETKAEESINTQELIIGAKHDEMQQIINGKKTKTQMLVNKGNQIAKHHLQVMGQLNSTLNQVQLRLAKLDRRTMELAAEEKTLDELEKKTPRALEEDYHMLTDEDQKITRELVKYEKLCNEALKAKSKKEKEMYDEYYDWEDRQKRKQTKANNDTECRIF